MQFDKVFITYQQFSMDATSAKPVNTKTSTPKLSVNYFR